ncbi:MAG: hypothetical protein ACRDDY_02735 [Clostridium sp.]|uniref:hypothetical protein n=1 Tax=Clostridium sp. TaxID=1506 RepID=UPI003EE6FC06
MKDKVMEIVSLAYDLDNLYKEVEGDNSSCCITLIGNYLTVCRHKAGEIMDGYFSVGTIGIRTDKKENELKLNIIISRLRVEVEEYIKLKEEMEVI